MASKRKCPNCKSYNKEFVTGPNGVQAFCNIDCMTSYGYANKPKGQAIKQKADRQRMAEKKEKLKTASDWAKEAQQAVNAYIRARDSGKPCISCDKPDNGQHQRHASHYRSVGACKQLRFNTFNIHASCQQCNTEKSGNLIEYRIRLVKLLGSDRVEWLESQNEIARYSIDYLKRVKRIFNRRARHIAKLRGY